MLICDKQTNKCQGQMPACCFWQKKRTKYDTSLNCDVKHFFVEKYSFTRTSKDSQRPFF